MKFYLTTFALLISFGMIAQIEFRTGDAQLEKELNTANETANNDLVAFKKTIAADYQIGIPIIDKMLDMMQPAEVLLAARIKHTLGISIELVIESYKTNKAQGWGVIAKDLGIKPGSPEFHALKGKSKNKSHPSSNGHGNSNGKGKGKSH